MLENLLNCFHFHVGLGAQIPDFCGIRKNSITAKTTLPVIKEKEEVGQCYGQLDPLPVGDKIGDSRENYDSKGEEHLNHNSHNPPLLRTHDLCHWRETNMKVKEPRDQLQTQPTDVAPAASTSIPGILQKSSLPTHARVTGCASRMT